MKHEYRLLIGAAAAALSLSSAQAQHWAPFRPGAIHSFRTSVGDTVFTTRLDSAYVSAANDSVYTFNRILRQHGQNAFKRTANSFFGAQLIARPARREFELATVAEAGRPAAGLLLKPYAAAGSVWPAAPGSLVTVTLTSKAVQTVAGQPDSVATFTLSDGRSLVLSRRHGLVQAPKWLQAGAASQTLRLEQAPVAFAQSMYAPARVFDFQVGDEFGYYTENFMSAFGCPSSHSLRRITGRQLTADSLIFTYIQQTVTHRSGAPGCTPAGDTYSWLPPARVAVALNGGTWVPTRSWQQPTKLRLLTLEYALVREFGRPTGQPVVALPLTAATSPVGPCNLGRPMRYLRVAATGGPVYYPGVDYGYQLQAYTAGVGESIVDFYALTYSRRRQPDGSFQVCGSPTGFTTLLPTRAAQAAARCELYPNPAARQATLRLLAPAALGTRLTLHDATGRQVWQQEVERGRSSVEVPLGLLPAGLYVVQLQLPGEAPVALRLQHQP